MSTVKSFSLSDDAIEILDTIPKKERSEFVTRAILERAKYQTQLQVMDAIENFPRFSSEGESVVDTLRSIREESK